MPAGKTESNFELPTFSIESTSSIGTPPSAATPQRRRVRRPLSAFHSACIVAGIVSALTACNRKSAEQCDQAQTTVRQALQTADFTAAKQWREYAYKHCADTTALGSMDREIVDKETQVAQAKQREEAEEARAKQYISLFTKFVADHREAPEKSSGSPDCGDDARAARTKQRWCKATRNVADAGQFEVRYWEADPRIVRFSTQLPKAVSCEDLGGSASVIKSWEVPAGGASAKRFHCDMTSGSLQGMRAVVTGAAGAQAHVFTAEYLAVDEALRKYAQAE